MLPTNVMTFMKKMVASEEAATSSTQNIPDVGPGTFGKLKQTLSSSLLTAQDRVNKMSPKPSSIPIEIDSTYSDNQHQQSMESVAANQNNNLSTGNAVSSASNTATATINKQQNEPAGRRAGACRVCLKSFKPNDFHKICFECKQRVCEDCASYSKLEENEDANMWRCSVCRRKMASRVCMPHDSTDSLLDVPVLEALQRRHSDAKLGSTQTLAPTNGAILAPPRSPELRRHSDVSPASLKELEKLKGCKTPGDDLDWQRGGGRSIAPSRSGSPPRQEDINIGPPLSRKIVRRASNIGRQHSYDDEPLPGSVSGTLGLTAGETGFGVPSMPRRKSAYDVFATGTLQPGVTNNITLRSPGDGVITIAPQIPILPNSRRSSIRIPHVTEDMQNDESRSEEIISSALTVDEDRPIRRRGSQLPDLAALQSRGAIPSNLATCIPQPLPTFTGPNLEDLEAPRRQTSLDGEAIKIVIHDVDSGPICSSKRRIVLRRDPTDKAHRTRGFGMRVVGGKTGADGKLFAYIVWTVPGGAAEKNGLQQGDKILEWNGMSLIDRSFEEVCSIMDRTGDVVELLVEHATDFRMCDLFDENLPPGSSGGTNGGPRRPGDDPVSLILMPEPETTIDKSPASPTRRKLPKTPEQIAREKQVSGRVQIQVWYHAERNELVISLMAADDLALRNEAYGHGNLPEAYAKVRILPKFGDGLVQQTEVSTPTQNPIWNATLTFTNVTADILMDHYIDIQLWDLVPHTESIFLGECNIELQKAFLGDRAIWCRLEDPKGLRGITMSKSFSVSPRGSLAPGPQIDITRLLRRDSNTQKSISDDMDLIGDSTCLLHPDHAYVAGSRRGSSQSETMELEVYQLNKDFSRSLPGSRRSSFQGAEHQNESELPATPPTTYMVGRRRSSLARKDTEEVLKSLKSVRGELGRTMSLGTEQSITSSNIRMGSRRHSRAVLPSNPVSRRSSIYDVTKQHHFQICVDNNTINTLADDEHKYQHWMGSGSYLPPQTVKQALNALKHTTSAINVSQNAANDWRYHLAASKQQPYHLSSQNTDHRENMRKGSMFNLTSTSSVTNNISLRKSSMFALNVNVNDDVSDRFGSSRFQEKSNMYADGITTIHNVNRKSSISVTSPITKRKERSETTMLRKQSIDPQQYNSSKASNNFNNFMDNKCMSITKTTTPITTTITATAAAATTTSSSSNLSSFSTSIKTGTYTDYGLKLGPGQIHPKNYRLITARHGELKMGFTKIKGTVEIEILCARNIVTVDCETPPDTYVKCYIKDGEHLRHKKKTRVVRRAIEPIYKQTIKYQSSDVFGRNIVIMLWQRCVGFEHNQGLGGTEVNLDKIEMAEHIGGWYPLFPMHSYGGFDSENSS